MENEMNKTDERETSVEEIKSSSFEENNEPEKKDNTTERSSDGKENEKKKKEDDSREVLENDPCSPISSEGELDEVIARPARRSARKSDNYRRRNDRERNGDHHDSHSSDNHRSRSNRHHDDSRNRRPRMSKLNMNPETLAAKTRYMVSRQIDHGNSATEAELRNDVREILKLNAEFKKMIRNREILKTQLKTMKEDELEHIRKINQQLPAHLQTNPHDMTVAGPEKPPQFPVLPPSAFLPPSLRAAAVANASATSAANTSVTASVPAPFNFNVPPPGQPPVPPPFYHQRGNNSPNSGTPDPDSVIGGAVGGAGQRGPPTNLPPPPLMDFSKPPPLMQTDIGPPPAAAKDSQPMEAAPQPPVFNLTSILTNVLKQQVSNLNFGAPSGANFLPPEPTPPQDLEEDRTHIDSMYSPYPSPQEFTEMMQMQMMSMNLRYGPPPAAAGRPYFPPQMIPRDLEGFFLSAGLGLVQHDTPPQLRKLFIGGLSHDTSDEQLGAYFTQWGPVVDAIVIRDQNTKHSRGFGFVTFASLFSAEAAMKDRPHVIGGKTVDSKRAIPREQMCAIIPPPFFDCNPAPGCKILLNGVLQGIHSVDSIRIYFESFGTLDQVEILGQPRGLGFVVYEEKESADRCLAFNNGKHVINDRKIDAKLFVQQTPYSTYWKRPQPAAGDVEKQMGNLRIEEKPASDSGAGTPSNFEEDSNYGGTTTEDDCNTFENDECSTSSAETEASRATSS